MAKVASSEGELQVSQCYCETGRKRHRIPKSIPIPFESTPPVVGHNPNHDTEDESNEDSTVSDGAIQEQEIDLQGVQFIGNGDGMDVDDEPLAFLEAVEGPGAPDTVGLVLDELFDAGGLEFEFVNGFVPQEPTLEADTSFEEEGPPQIATWRINLTALSQVYNIYMVAYADKIYVSRPRSCVTNALPVEPDLILRPRASTMALEVGGYLDEGFPHQVNHLIVGDLGDEEILLLAYDDGDVIGYYTRSIEEELLRREREGRDDETVPEPFFHENVEKSAWGLAVHKKSRIIAVSSNTHSVAVFVFALTGKPYEHNPGVDSVEFFRNVAKDEDGNVLEPHGGVALPLKESERAPKAAVLERAVQRRDANWRIVLETGRMGTNIPNIAFSSRPDGEADKVVAVDINGKLWLMDIWHFNNYPHIKIEGLHSNRSRARFQGHDHLRRPRGWGVLVLPESSFLPTRDYMSSLGVRSDEIRYASNDKIGRWVDISKGIKNIPNNSTVHPWVRSGNIERFSFNPLEPRRAQLENSWYDFDTNEKHPSFYYSDPGKDSRLGRFKPKNYPKPKPVLADGSSILRTYELDVELRSFEEDGTGIMFEKAIDQSRPVHAVLPSMRVSHERLANLIHVPELSLVVAGSLCGRVALVTLTRPPPGFLFKRGFKIEAILPLKRDEDDHKRPICPLLGVAIGPVPSSGNAKLADGSVGRRRYRIMLHYYDLRILSYELSRSSATDPLSIL